VKSVEKLVKVMIHVPQSLKIRLDQKRHEGYTISGYVRTVLEKELNQPTAKGSQKGKR
jgi:hypothetical protein